MSTSSSGVLLRAATASCWRSRRRRPASCARRMMLDWRLWRPRTSHCGRRLRSSRLLWRHSRRLPLPRQPLQGLRPHRLLRCCLAPLRPSGRPGDAAPRDSSRGRLHPRSRHRRPHLRRLLGRRSRPSRLSRPSRRRLPSRHSRPRRRPGPGRRSRPLPRVVRGSLDSPGRAALGQRCLPRRQRPLSRHPWLLPRPRRPPRRHRRPLPGLLRLPPRSLGSPPSPLGLHRPPVPPPTVPSSTLRCLPPMPLRSPVPGPCWTASSGS